jgi:hypothetical protein
VGKTFVARHGTQKRCRKNAPFGPEWILDFGLTTLDGPRLIGAAKRSVVCCIFCSFDFPALFRCTVCTHLPCKTREALRLISIRRLSGSLALAKEKAALAAGECSLAIYRQV